MAFGTSQQSGPDCVGFLDNFRESSWAFVADFMEDRNGTDDVVVQVDWIAERTMGSCGPHPDQHMINMEGLLEIKPTMVPKPDSELSPELREQLIALRRIREIDDQIKEWKKTQTMPSMKGWSKADKEQFQKGVNAFLASRRSQAKIKRQKREWMAKAKARCVAAGFPEEMWDRNVIGRYGWEPIWLERERTLNMSVSDMINDVANRFQEAVLPNGQKVSIVHGVPFRPWGVVMDQP